MGVRHTMEMGKKLKAHQPKSQGLNLCKSLNMMDLKAVSNRFLIT